MAITIIKKPHRISSSNNNNIWVYTSDVNTLIYTIFTVKETITEGIIAQKKVYKKPNNPYMEVDLSDILSQMGESILVNTNDIVTSSTLPSYTIEIQEFIKNNDIVTSLIKYIDNQVTYYYDGNVNDIDYLLYNTNKYNLNTTSKASFLSNSQAITQLSSTQKNYLKIFNIDNIPAKVNIVCYDSDGDYVANNIIGLPSASCYSFNLSPSVILSQPFLTDEGLESLIATYKVVITNNSNEEISEGKIYKIKETNCSVKETNIIYKNSVGGYDSIRLINRVETLNVNKTYVNKYMGNNKFSVDGKYFNGEQIISTSTTTLYVASTELLDDYDSKLMKELFISNKVFVVVGDYMVEVLMENKTYKVPQRHTNGGKKGRVEITFRSPLSIDKLESMISANDIRLNDNPDSAYYLTASGDFVIDGFLRNIILKY